MAWPTAGASGGGQARDTGPLGHRDTTEKAQPAEEAVGRQGQSWFQG